MTLISSFINMFCKYLLIKIAICHFHSPLFAQYNTTNIQASNYTKNISKVAKQYKMIRNITNLAIFNKRLKIFSNIC